MKRHIITIVVSSIVLIVLGFFTLGQDIQAAGTMIIEIQCIDTGVGAHAKANARGTVFDAEPKENEKFNIIAGASITLTANNVTRTGTTNSGGDFDIPNLPPGWWADKTVNYTVTKSGFDTLEGSFTCSPKVLCPEVQEIMAILAGQCPPPPPPVGGIGEQPDISEFPLETQESPGTNYTPYITGAAAVVVALVIFTAGAWYAMRRRQ